MWWGTGISQKKNFGSGRKETQIVTIPFILASLRSPHTYDLFCQFYFLYYLLKVSGFWLHFSIPGPLGQLHMYSKDINKSKLRMPESLFPAKSLSSELRIQKSKCFMCISAMPIGPHFTISEPSFPKYTAPL